MLAGWGSLLAAVCEASSAVWTGGGLRGLEPLVGAADFVGVLFGLGDLRIFRDRYSIPAGEKREGQSPSSAISGAGWSV